MEGLEACAVCFIAVMFAPPEPNKHAVPWDRRRLLRDSAEDVRWIWAAARVSLRTGLVRAVQARQGTRRTLSHIPEVCVCQVFGTVT